VTPAQAEILTPETLAFVAELAGRFEGRRAELLARRADRQKNLDSGILPNFLPETAQIRSSDWKISPPPPDLQDRRVEITGPSGDTKMVINAFNSGAKIYMADFEDAQSPTWEATMQGQINLRDAIDRKIAFSSPEGKSYKLNENVATLLVRPRGWHLPEKHILLDGNPISGSLFDFGVFFYTNAERLINKGTGPYFYLPKLESHLEARLWNEVFSFSEERLGIPVGTIKATVLIETILAGFEMDEILYELKEHSAGLNCGRWDYIFSFIKKLRRYPDYVLPDRAQVTMDKAFLASYVALAIRTCHRRGAHAIGGMSAYIPVRNDDQANKLAFDKVRADKEREVRAGHDGTWVAHPGMVPLAKEVFDSGMPGPNQLSNLREDVKASATDLLKVPDGDITEQGLRTNVSVAIQYLESWLRGRGAVPIFNLMEDAATAEICRAQVWQWIHRGAKLADGRPVTIELARSYTVEELDKIRRTVGAEAFSAGRYDMASQIFDQLISADEMQEFLTAPSYEQLLILEKRGMAPNP
jgi:malate synthase